MRKFASPELDTAQATIEAVTSAGQEWPSRRGGGTSHHVLKLGKVVNALQTSQTRYLAPEPDKTYWIVDDHAVRFTTRLVSDRRALGRSWTAFQGNKEVRDLYEELPKHMCLHKAEC
jgi:hypothetical protein